ncbi:MAG: UTP--glucose-1-phosphate uridylyltransferase [bacterium]
MSQIDDQQYVTLHPQTAYQQQLSDDVHRLQDSPHTHSEFQALINCIQQLQKQDKDPQALWQFLDLYMRGKKQHVTAASHKTDLSKLTPLTETDLVHYRHLETQSQEKEKDLWQTCAVIKLNGGLGTSMGCEGPKSLINVYKGKSFLDIINIQHQFLNQFYQHDANLLFMNSIFTHASSEPKYKDLSYVHSFIQHQFPRIHASSWEPLHCKETLNAYYPPGHGDVYGSLEQSGHLDRLLNEGVEYVFISNSDNLAAVPDMKILAWMREEKIDFLMEVTPKTRLDVKGGALIKDKETTRLLERADVPETQLSLFEDISTFQLFNTNNIWVNLKALKKRLKTGLLLPVIHNNKTIENQPIIQLETAMGSAITVFDTATAIVVNRDRFMPIKKTSDLFLLQSDLIDINSKTGILSFNKTQLSSTLPSITFSKSLETMAGYKRYIKEIPSLMKLKSLTIKGDQILTAKTSLEGDVLLDGSVEK